jgi:ABC-2 type transport system permease protein
MRPEPAVLDSALAAGAQTGGSMTAVARLTAHRIIRTGALWGLVFGLFVVSSVTNFTTLADTAAQRAKLAQTFGSNAGMHALFGAARHLDTVAGFTAWRSLGVLSLLGAVWGMLAAARLTRGEEDAGRWEMLLAGRTTRRRAAVQAMAGLGLGLGALWVVTAAICVAVGRSSRADFSVSAALFLSIALVASAAMFLALGALAAQLTSSRRQANAITACVLAASFLVRMIADSGSGIPWLRWMSPLGWVEQMQALTGSRPTALVPILGLIAAAALATAWLAGKRDLGASALPVRDTGRAHTALLNGQLGLAARLAKPVVTGWVAGLAVGGLVGGLIAESASTAVSGSATVQRALERLGAHRAGAAVYLGIFFIMAAAVIAFAVAGQLAATRNEEAEGYLLAHLAFVAAALLGWPVGSRVALAPSPATPEALLTRPGCRGRMCGGGQAPLVASCPRQRPYETTDDVDAALMTDTSG